MRAGDALGMELDAVDRQRLVAQALDGAVPARALTTRPSGRPAGATRQR